MHNAPLSSAGRSFLCPTRAAADPAFQSWFGDSQVRGADGSPLLLWHGTEHLFSAFDPTRIDPRSSRPAFWLANRRAVGFYGHRAMPLYVHAPRILEAEDGFLTRWVRQALRDNLEAEIDGDDPVWDGVVFRDVVDGDTPSDVWAIFSPTAFKSPTAARFDPDTCDIYA